MAFAYTATYGYMDREDVPFYVKHFASALATGSFIGAFFRNFNYGFWSTVVIGSLMSVGNGFLDYQTYFDPKRHIRSDVGRDPVHVAFYSSMMIPAPVNKHMAGVKPTYIPPKDNVQ